MVDSQCSRVREVGRSDLLCRNQKRSRDKKERMVLVLNYHPALLKIQRPRHIKDFLVRAKLEPEVQSDKGMFGCGKVRCKIFKFVKMGSILESTVEKKSFHVNHSFDCDSSGVVYLITYKRCAKHYVGSTITEFRKRFNNHKSSMNRCGKEQRDICGEHLHEHFFEEGHLGLED